MNAEAALRLLLGQPPDNFATAYGLTRAEFRAYDFLIEYESKGPVAMPGLS
jgi:hypothetical protein